MALSCSWYSSDMDCKWYWYIAEDFSILPESEKNIHCYSCNKPIDAGNEVVRIGRGKSWYREEVDPLSPYYLCERCGEIFLTLAEIGYDRAGLLDDEQSMQDNLEEYWKETGFDPDKYK